MARLMMLMIGLILLGGVFPMELVAQEAGTVEADYAAREAASVELEEFTGGWIGVVIVIAAVLILIAILIPW